MLMQPRRLVARIVAYDAKVAAVAGKPMPSISLEALVVALLRVGDSIGYHL